MRILRSIVVVGLVSTGSLYAQFESDNDGFTVDSSAAQSSVPLNVQHSGETTAMRFELEQENFTVSAGSGSGTYTVARAPSSPNNGPTEVYVYRNASGVYKFPPVSALGDTNTGVARYRWSDGTKHEDKLTFIATGRVTETDGFSVPIGSKVRVWAFMAQDVFGRSFFLYFGTDAIINTVNGRRYPLYYSFEAPGPKANVHRILTTDGTKRD